MFVSVVVGGGEGESPFGFDKDIAQSSSLWY